MVFAFLNAYRFPKPPETVCEQKKAKDKNKPKDCLGLTAQIYGSEWIVGDMDDDARDDAVRAPVEPTDEDSKQHGRDKMRPKPMKRSENNGRDENGYPRTAPRFQQTTKNKASKTNLFCYWGKNAAIEYSSSSGNKPLKTLSIFA